MEAAEEIDAPEENFRSEAASDYAGLIQDVEEILDIFTTTTYALVPSVGLAESQNAIASTSTSWTAGST